MEKNLTVMGIVQEGIVIGLKNIISILGAVVLWAVTIWIPYLNVGTTIAIISMPVALSKGKVMSPLEIFDPKYRKYMGEFFVTMGLMQLAIVPATLFMIVPGLILSLAWSQAIFLVLDKGDNPSEAISKSNELTDGYKWTIFGGLVLIGIVTMVAVMIFSWIYWLLGMLVLIALSPAYLGAYAHIYKTLVGNDGDAVVEEQLT